MSRFTVIWPKPLLGDLAGIWMESESRTAVTQAVQEIDSALVIDPTTKGTNLAEGLRKLDEPPLQVIFEVEELDRLVRIVKVALIEPSPS
jgi:succinyl-CoA synthetase beta subunit